MNKELDGKELSERVGRLSAIGATVEKAVRYLNAEFAACFYANKKALWVSYIGENGKPQARVLGTFA